jgi:UDP-N-acetylglucosamine acyltransferase
VHDAAGPRQRRMIHPTAIVDTRAEIAGDVAIGPYSVIGADVQIGPGTWIGPHVVIEGRARIGRGNRIFQFCSIGGPPQDKKYAGEDTGVEIGNGNTIREYVTINRGTALDAGVTRLGDDNWIMAYVHLAHDCQVGSHTIFANLSQLAGHVQIGDWAILGGNTIVHQFVRIGAHGFTGMCTYLDRDLPPYVKAAGQMAKPYGINSEGLRRKGFSAQTIQALKRAYRTLYRAGLSAEEVRRELAEQAAVVPEVRRIAEFVDGSKRGIIR